MPTRVCITGIGYSEVSRDSGRSEGDLAVDACRRAIADAGLTGSAIDGITVHPERTSPPVAFQGPSLPFVQRSLALKNLKYWQSFGLGPAQLSAVIGGIYAIASGGCQHLLTYRAVKRQPRRYLPRTADVSKGYDEDAYTLPFGAPGGAARVAMWAMRHMHEFGTTQEQLGAVVVQCRANAATNPQAFWREPITLDEYMSSRWVAAPFKLLDCDYPVDGAVAMVLSASDVAADTSRPPVYVESIGHSPGPETSWTHWPDMTHMASKYASDQMWSRTSLRQSDVDVAELYDGFSWLAICWLEDLGFVRKGEGGAFFEAGETRLTGSLPSNTDGGSLGMGRLHGVSDGYIY